MSDWFTVRRQARRDVHTTFALLATYTDSLDSAIGLHVRWHSRFTAAIGDIPGGDYARVMENIDRLVFSVEELAERQVNPRRAGVVIFNDYPEHQFVLDVREPSDGPITLIWTVTRVATPSPQPDPGVSDLALGTDPLMLGSDELVLGSDG